MNPGSREELIYGLDEWESMQHALMKKVPHDVRPELERIRTSVFGIIEEALEYLNSLGHKPWRPNPQPRNEQLEELTDMFFFILELKAQSGFSWDEIIDEYIRKHAVNLKRYEDAKSGDFKWDNRSEKRAL
jgi:phosphoribosyl-ATP pyrophosphohydrolase